MHNLPGYYSMRDLNEESSSCGWPLFYGDKTLSNGQFYNSYLSSATADACLTYDKDVVKQTMLEHEAEFRSQVKSSGNYSILACHLSGLLDMVYE